ncbi:MAG: type II toxin-antitoxin system HicB family antitoxin [Agathobacter sp.]|nr:type II toxin-antitoxin system HicB family antitoxin [Agathobacter sp.]
MKKVYPVIFTQAEDVTLVEVPDLEILTEGKDMADAIEMARDAIGLYGISREDHGEVIPDASSGTDVDVTKGAFAEEGVGVISYVDVDFAVYRRKVDNKVVRTNVTLPNWLKQEAEKAGINVSKVLQEALMTKLGVYR